MRTEKSLLTGEQKKAFKEVNKRKAAWVVRKYGMGF